VTAARAALMEADALLVAGSSLMVYSGFRFVQAAVAAGLPVAAVNLGRTRADDLLVLKVEKPVGEALGALAAQLAGP
jgi:NAD-dependent SIR2 family protein deacetylase